MNAALSIESHGTPLNLEIVKESKTQFTTREVYSQGVYALNPTDRKRKVVRWDKFTMRRLGDDVHSEIRILKVLKTVPNGATLY